MSSDSILRRSDYRNRSLPLLLSRAKIGLTVLASLLVAALFLLVWSSPAGAQGSPEQYSECVDKLGEPASTDTGFGSFYILTDEFEDCLEAPATIPPITADTSTLLELFRSVGVHIDGWLIAKDATSKTYLTQSGHLVVVTGTLTSDGQEFAAVLEILDTFRASMAQMELTGHLVPHWVLNELALAERPQIDLVAEGLDGCRLPADLVDHCDDPVELLPMWRWSRTTHIWTDWGGNIVTSTIRAIIGGSFDMLVSVQFFIAAFTWDVLARLLYLALSADFTKDLLVGVDNAYYHMMHNLLDSGLFWLVAVVGFLAALWALFRKGAEDAWRTLLSSVLPLGLAVYMLMSISSSYDPNSGFPTDVDNLTPTKDDDLPDYGDEQVLDTSRTVTTRGGDVIYPYRDRYQGTPAWLFVKMNSLTDELGDGLAHVATSLTGDRNMHSSYCSVFSHQLERLYLQTTLDKRRRDGGDDSLQARDYSPIALSRLWERAYLAGWAQAQFGAPQAAYNGSCLWAEANAPEVIPPETMIVWAATCGEVGNSDYNDLTPDIVDGPSAGGYLSSLYGCEGRISTDVYAENGNPTNDRVALSVPNPPAPGAFLNYRDESRAWRAFLFSSDEEARSLLALSSACGFVTHDSAYVGETLDGAPLRPSRDEVAINENLGTVAVRRLNAYLEAPYIGMQVDPGNNERWFGVDACAAWITGAVVESSADKRHLKGVGQADRRGHVQGLNSTFVKNRAALECRHARQSAANVSENVGQIPGLETVTTPTAAHQAANNICTYGGDRYFHRFLYALIVMLTAFAYLFSLAGLAAGTALAQILLGLIFMMLPIILLAAAIPVQAARKFLPRILKTAIGAFLAHSIFLLLLSFMVYVIDVVSFAVLNATDPGTSVRVIALALIPYVAKKVVAGVTKQFGFDFTSMKGALKVTSGIAAGAAGGGGERGSLAQRYARRMGYSMVSPYRVRSAMTGGARGMRMTPNAALAGGVGAGAGAAAALTGTASPRLGRQSWGGASMPGAPGTTHGRGQRGAPGGAGVPAGQTGRPGQTKQTGTATRHAPAAQSSSGAFPTSPNYPGNPDLSGYDPRLQRDPDKMLHQPTDVSAGGLLVPQGAELPPPPEAPQPAPPPPTDTTDYDPDRYQGGAADVARIGGHAALWGAGFMRRHALLTYAAAGVAVTGVGLPAAAAVYLGGKAVKKVARRPTQAVVGKAKQGVTSGIQRWQDIRAGQSQAQLRFRQLADRGARRMPGAPPVTA